MSRYIDADKIIPKIAEYLHIEAGIDVADEQDFEYYLNEAKEIIQECAVDDWIPVSERLPGNGYWLWSATSGAVQKDFYWDGHWKEAEELGYEVIAWRPIPAPYKEDEHGEENK